MMEIRDAKADDQGDIASLMYSAGPEVYDFIYKTDQHQATDYIEFEFKSGRGFCGYKNLTVAMQEGIAVGTGGFYDGRQYTKLMLGTVVNMFKFYGPIKVWPVLLRSGHAGSVMKKPKPDELYLANFGVSPTLRGSGIGRAMIEEKMAMAISKGYRLFSLDVADTNTRAEKLYKSLGLEVVKHKKFSGKRAGIEVPNAKKMEIVLQAH